MAQKLRKAGGRHLNRFPPEADGEFDVVPQEQIVEWRQKLNEEFGLGRGRLTVVEEPA